MRETDLGRKVDWFGSRGKVVGMWFGPAYAVEIEDGRVVTVGEGCVTFLTAPADMRTIRATRNT